MNKVLLYCISLVTNTPVLILVLTGLDQVMAVATTMDFLAGTMISGLHIPQAPTTTPELDIQAVGTVTSTYPR